MESEQRLLGRLEEFKRHAEYRFGNLETSNERIEKKIDALNEFKWRMAGGGVVLGFFISGAIEFARFLIDRAHG